MVAVSAVNVIILFPSFHIAGTKMMFVTVVAAAAVVVAMCLLLSLLFPSPASWPHILPPSTNKISI
eukprot:13140042-Ditylum_brightwellii.AAC.1